MMNIYIEGYYGIQNLGDDYILMSILSSLSKVPNDKIDIVAIVSLGDDYNQLFSLFPNLHCTTIKTQKARRKQLFSKKTYIFGGGGLFPTDNWKLYIKLFCKVMINKIMGGKNIVYGIDLCKLNGIISKQIWRCISYIVDVIVVRNKLSFQLLENAGIKDKVYYFPDVTFALDEISLVKKNDVVKEKLKEFGVWNKQYVIFVLAKPWSAEEILDGPYSTRYKKLCKQMASLCNRCIKDGYEILFIPFFHENDRDFIHSIEQYLEGKYHICEENEIGIEVKRLLFAEAKACISMRFHGIAFSLYQGIPCEAICYAPKSTELMKEGGVEDFCVRLGIRKDSCFFKEFDIDDDKLNVIYEKVMNSVCSEKFQKASEKLRKEAKKGEDLLIKTLIE